MFPDNILSFVLSFTPISTSMGESIFPEMVCDNGTVSIIPGVNAVFISVDVTEIPDILSISATPEANGIITIPSNGGSFMSVSAINIGIGDAPGSQDATITVSADDGGVGLPVFFQLCETNALGACISQLGGDPIVTTIGNVPSFFAVFAFDQASGGIALDPANSRVFLRFTDTNNTVRSVTSAAISVQ